MNLHITAAISSRSQDHPLHNTSFAHHFRAPSAAYCKKCLADRASTQLHTTRLFRANSGCAQQLVRRVGIRLALFVLPVGW